MVKRSQRSIPMVSLWWVCRKTKRRLWSNLSK